MEKEIVRQTEAPDIESMAVGDFVFSYQTGVMRVDRLTEQDDEVILGGKNDLGRVDKINPITTPGFVWLKEHDPEAMISKDYWSSNKVKDEIKRLGGLKTVKKTSGAKTREKKTAKLGKQEAVRKMLAGEMTMEEFQKDYE